MAKRRGDDRTMNLLDWQPPEIVRRFEEGRVRTATLRAQIARAVSETLKDSELSRDEIAAAMGAWLDEDVSVHVLNAYASEAREDHSISFVRLLALMHATGDVRPLQLAAEMFEHAVIEARWLPAIDDARWTDQIEQAKAQQKLARRAWKGGAR